MEIDGCSAVVSGGASGLGLATARALRDAGAHVVLLDLAASRGLEVAGALGERVHFVAGDVRDSAAVATAVDVAGDNGPLRVAVSCAGIARPARTLGRRGVLALEDFAETIDVNLNGTFNLVRLAAERMSATEPHNGERGIVVTTASVVAFDGPVGYAAYAAAKAGVAGMTLPLARELAAHLVRVVAIAPGVFDTPILSALPRGRYHELHADVPHPHRKGRPEEFAALVVHLVENSMINGEVVRIDGALRLPVGG